MFAQNFVLSFRFVTWGKCFLAQFDRACSQTYFLSLITLKASAAVHSKLLFELKIGCLTTSESKYVSELQCLGPPSSWVAWESELFPAQHLLLLKSSIFSLLCPLVTPKVSGNEFLIFLLSTSTSHVLSTDQGGKYLAPSSEWPST